MWLTIRAANNQINTVLQISYWALIGCYHCLTVDRFSLSLGSIKWQMTKQDLITPWLLLSLLRKIQVYLQIYKNFSINYIDNRLRLCKKTSWASLRDLALGNNWQRLCQFISNFFPSHVWILTCHYRPQTMKWNNTR